MKYGGCGAGRTQLEDQVQGTSACVCSVCGAADLYFSYLLLAVHAVGSFEGLCCSGPEGPASPASFVGDGRT